MKKFIVRPRANTANQICRWRRSWAYTIFFGLAYVDWYEDASTHQEEAFEKLLIPSSPPGPSSFCTVPLRTNAQILDELLTKWEEMGYTFRSLDQLVEESPADTKAD